MRKSKPETRAINAKESFANAADAIGPIEHGMRLFTITRGQWSMIDAVLHCLDEVGRSKLSIWTWTIAEYEVQVVQRLRIDERITAGRLVIDHGARNKNAAIIADWKKSFGDESVRYVLNHAKIATIESDTGHRILLRGSMNLNYNPRFENFDLSEGGADFELVKEIENDLPILPDDCSGKSVYAASRVSDAFAPEQLELFRGIKVWAK